MYSNNNNSIQFFNSILSYLCAESTATMPIIDTAQRKYNNNTIMLIIIIIIVTGKVKTPFNYNVLTIIQFNSIQFIIYVPSQQLQGQLQTQHSVDTIIIIVKQ
jgi:hypothetical protein